MKKSAVKIIFSCLAFFALSLSINAQNNTIDIFQGGVNLGLEEATNSEAYVDQTDESGTLWSKVVIQQAGDAQYADIEQSNVDHATVSTAQIGAQNNLNIQQVDGEILFLGARQNGVENTLSSSQSGNNNYAIISQVGTGNATNVTQSGFNNHTMSHANLGAMHLTFLEQSDPPYDFSHDFDGTGKTDGIVQVGQDNTADLTQSGDNNGAFIYQEGQMNEATIVQSGSHDASCILQRGMNNIAQTNQ